MIHFSHTILIQSCREVVSCIQLNTGSNYPFHFIFPKGDTSDFIIAGSYSALVADYQPTHSGSSETNENICPTTVTKYVTVTHPGTTCIPTTTATTISASPIEAVEDDKNRNEFSSFITLPFTCLHGVIAIIFFLLIWLIWDKWDWPKLWDYLKFEKGGKGRRILHDAA